MRREADPRALGTPRFRGMGPEGGRHRCGRGWGTLKDTWEGTYSVWRHRSVRVSGKGSKDKRGTQEVRGGRAAGLRPWVTRGNP